jgi:hypothetical protein
VMSRDTNSNSNSKQLYSEKSTLQQTFINIPMHQ